jgi:hypothetical protein
LAVLLDVFGSENIMNDKSKPAWATYSLVFDGDCIWLHKVVYLVMTEGGYFS